MQLRLGWLLLCLFSAATSAADIKLDARTPYLRVESAVLVGNKGEEEMDVSVATQCGVESWVFDHAELLIHRSLYADAQITEMPPMGCGECSPLRVRWFHEPTGYLSFDVRVYRRRHLQDC